MSSLTCIYAVCLTYIVLVDGRIIPLSRQSMTDFDRLTLGSGPSEKRIKDIGRLTPDTGRSENGIKDTRRLTPDTGLIEQSIRDMERLIIDIKRIEQISRESGIKRKIRDISGRPTSGDLEISDALEVPDERPLQNVPMYTSNIITVLLEAFCEYLRTQNVISLPEFCFEDGESLDSSEAS